MRYKFNKFLFLCAFSLFFIGCKSTKISDSKPFEIVDSYYQSWQVNENKRGTNIIIEIKSCKENVTFDTIVFRGYKAKAELISEERKSIVKGIVTIGVSPFNITSDATELPDQLIYIFNGKKEFVLLTNLRRVDMFYFKQ